MNQVEIYVPERGGLGLPGESDAVSLRLPEGLSIEEWEGVGRRLCSAEKSLMWWIGDWWAYGEHKYGVKTAITSNPKWTGPKFEVCSIAGTVARRFEPTIRIKGLTFSHHRVVASLPRGDAIEVLKIAEKQGWAVKEARAESNRRLAARKINAPIASSETCELSDLRAAASSGRKYGTIYADPPWRYDNQSTRAATGNHYGGMSVDEICELPVKELAADDAHLHLWTTNAFLFECPRIFEAWGFEFRSTFIWVKPQMGIGNYWRNSHEILLTAVRGDAKRFNDHSMMSWLEKARGAHSAKPEEVRNMIERASPGPYLELFARRRADNWDAWGNQIEKTLFHPGSAIAA